MSSKAISAELGPTWVILDSDSPEDIVSEASEDPAIGWVVLGDPIPDSEEDKASKAASALLNANYGPQSAASAHPVKPTAPASASSTAPKQAAPVSQPIPDVKTTSPASSSRPKPEVPASTPAPATKPPATAPATKPPAPVTKPSATQPKQTNSSNTIKSQPKTQADQVRQDASTRASEYMKIFHQLGIIQSHNNTVEPAYKSSMTNTIRLARSWMKQHQLEVGKDDPTFAALELALSKVEGRLRFL